MTDFTLIFCCALLLNVFATLRSSELWKKWFATNGSSNDSSSSLTLSSSTTSEDAKKEHAKWQTLLRKYLLVYLLATLSDWLQGPYVYALYADYGYEQHDIAVLFVAGFGSSMIFGSFIGGMADWGGRRTFVLLFSLVYASSCLTKRTYISFYAFFIIRSSCTKGTTSQYCILISFLP
jgi:Sugar-tranasporters, 12 TM